MSRRPRHLMEADPELPPLEPRVVFRACAWLAIGVLVLVLVAVHTT